MAIVHAVLTVDVDTVQAGQRNLLLALWGGYALLLLLLVIGIGARALRRRGAERALEKCLRELQQKGLASVPAAASEWPATKPPGSGVG